MPTFIPSHAEKLTDRVTLDTVIAVLEHYFDLSADGYLCQTRDLWNILVSAAARCTYIETVCNDLSTAPDGNTVRGYLNEQLTPTDHSGVAAGLQSRLGQSIAGVVAGSSETSGAGLAR